MTEPYLVAGMRTAKAHMFSMLDSTMFRDHLLEEGKISSR